MPRPEPNQTARPVRDDPIYQLAKWAVARSAAEFADLFTREDLQDLTSEVLAVYHRKWTQDASPDHPRAWMRKVAGAAVIDELRRRGARPRLASLPDDDADAENIIDAVFVDLRTPSAIAHSTHLVRSALARLGNAFPEDPRMIEMRHLWGMSNSEIAQELALKEETVKKRLQRATERLAGILAALSES